MWQIGIGLGIPAKISGPGFLDGAWGGRPAGEVGGEVREKWPAAERYAEYGQLGIMIRKDLTGRGPSGDGAGLWWSDPLRESPQRTAPSNSLLLFEIRR